MIGRGIHQADITLVHSHRLLVNQIETKALVDVNQLKIIMVVEWNIYMRGMRIYADSAGIQSVMIIKPCFVERLRRRRLAVYYIPKDKVLVICAEIHGHSPFQQVVYIITNLEAERKKFLNKTEKCSLL